MTIAAADYLFQKLRAFEDNGEQARKRPRVAESGLIRSLQRHFGYAPFK